MIHYTHTTLTDNQLRLLERIRRCASQVRCYPRLDVFEACQLISYDADLLDSEATQMFLRTMPQAIGRRLVIYRSHTNALSWDERWIISLIESVTRADYDSVYFMVNAVVQKKYRREAMQIASSMVKISA